MDISYCGTNFNGWQIQPNGVTVQEKLEEAISTILKSQISITGSGRTDTGVHATQQVAHFDVENISPMKLVFKLNSFLNENISINGIRRVKEDVSARFGATSRTYHYHIHQSKNPFKNEISYYCDSQLNIDQINKACEIIKDWQNFECFSKIHTQVSSFNCQISHASWSQIGSNHLFEISSNRFLRGMVRTIVGTLLDVGVGKKSMTDLKEILESKDRRKAGKVVPAEGLFLQKVVYPQHIYLD